MKIVTLQAQYNKKKGLRKSKKKEAIRKKYATYLDKELQDMEFSSNKEKKQFIKSKTKEYISGLGTIEIILIKLFLNWIINYFCRED